MLCVCLRSFGGQFAQLRIWVDRHTFSSSYRRGLGPWDRLGSLLLFLGFRLRLHVDFDIDVDFYFRLAYLLYRLSGWLLLLVGRLVLFLLLLDWSFVDLHLIFFGLSCGSVFWRVWRRRLCVVVSLSRRLVRAEVADEFVHSFVVRAFLL